ncbi:hypothetical protein [Geobacter sp.]|uniref:hypothetical protein n=1 Tax=Geobacter sp. TaxID=46610 RepID=UPI002617BB26|nr:hypothetical protein [Geobacter sp.]
MKKLLLAGVALISLTGCAAIHKPSPEEVKNANYGSYPREYQEVIKSYFEQTLIDPYSAVYSRWRGPSKGYMYDITGAYFGYRVCVDVNAKNRMGGYTGNQPYFFVIVNGTRVFRILVEAPRVSEESRRLSSSTGT